MIFRRVRFSMRVFGSLPGHKQTFQAKTNISSSLTSGHSSRQQVRQLCAMNDIGQLESDIGIKKSWLMLGPPYVIILISGNEMDRELRTATYPVLNGDG